MKKIIKVIPLMLLPLNTFALDDYYLKLDCGMSRVGDTYNIIPKDNIVMDEKGIDGIFGLGFGFNYGKIRPEINLNFGYNPYKKQELKNIGEASKIESKGKYNIYSLFVGVNIDLFEFNASHVFIGAGVGAAIMKSVVEGTYTKVDGSQSNFTETSKYQTNFAGMLRAGLSHPISESAYLDFAYEFHYYGDRPKKANSKITDKATGQVTEMLIENPYNGYIYSNSLRLGLRFML